MKKNLLALALLGLATGRVAAQPGTLAGPWVEVNTVGFATPAGITIFDLSVLSPTFAWGLGTTAFPPNPGQSNYRSVRTTDAAGTVFDCRPVQIGPYPFHQPTNLSVPVGATGNLTAFCGEFLASSPSNGMVVRTTDGGINWERITQGTQFASPAGFCNWACAFDANHVVAGGDPNPLPPVGNGTFELQYTSNASAQPTSAVVWTRATAVPPTLPNESLIVGSYTALGNTIWATTSATTPVATMNQCRVLRSTDQGHTWTVAPTPITLGEINRIAFKDALHGVAFATRATATEVITTADGGLSWTLQTLPNPLTADTLMGKFYCGGLTAVPGVGFVSYGAARPRLGVRADNGASFSPNGVGLSWRDLDKGHALYAAAGFLTCGINGFQGYLGGTTSAGGQGGLFQVGPGCAALRPLAARNEAGAAGAFAVVPNPSATGRFVLNLPQGLAAGGQLAVFDALGRPALARSLAAVEATGSVSFELPRAGMYVLRLTTPDGSSTRKLVVGE